MAGAFSHFPSSGKIWNEDLCEDRELAHAQFRPQQRFNSMILHDKKITFILNIHTNFCFFPTILHFDNIPKEWMYHSIISLHKSNQNLYVHVFEAFVSWQNMFEERAINCTKCSSDIPLLFLGSLLTKTYSPWAHWCWLRLATGRCMLFLNSSCLGDREEPLSRFLIT